MSKHTSPYNKKEYRMYEATIEFCGVFSTMEELIDYHMSLNKGLPYVVDKDGNGFYFIDKKSTRLKGLKRALIKETKKTTNEYFSRLFAKIPNAESL